MESTSEGKTGDYRISEYAGRIRVSRPPIESPTSPRTRLDKYGNFLRPAILQFLRAFSALDDDCTTQFRAQAASAYYKLGELYETQEQLVDDQDLRKMNFLLKDLFSQRVSGEQKLSTRLFLRSILFRIESSQPSALKLQDMKKYGLTSCPLLNLDQLVAVRVAHCLNKACIALMACQIELAYAYLDFILQDVSSIHTQSPELVPTSMLNNIKKYHYRICRNKISSTNCRGYGYRLRNEIKDFLDETSKIAAQIKRESHTCH